MLYLIDYLSDIGEMMDDLFCYFLLFIMGIVSGVIVNNYESKIKTGETIIFDYSSYKCRMTNSLKKELRKWRS